MKPGMWVAMVALSSFAVVQVNVSRLRGSVPPFVSVWFTPDDHLERAALRHRAGMVKLMADCDLSGQEDDLELPEREKVDAERADELNKRFEDVVLNERAEGKIV